MLSKSSKKKWIVPSDVDVVHEEWDGIVSMGVVIITDPRLLRDAVLLVVLP